jgi:hypothetical protein
MSEVGATSDDRALGKFFNQELGFGDPGLRIILGLETTDLMY